MRGKRNKLYALHWHWHTDRLLRWPSVWCLPPMSNSIGQTQSPTQSPRLSHWEPGRLSA